MSKLKGNLPHKILMKQQESLDVIIERIDNIIKNQELNHQENKEDHTRIENHVIMTNGRVKKLELWKMFLAGAWTIVSISLIPLGCFVLKDYFIQRTESTKNELKYEQITKKIESLGSEVDNKIKNAINENNNKQ